MAARFKIDRQGVKLIGEQVADMVDETGERVLQNMRQIVPVDFFALQRSLINDQQGDGVDRLNYVGVDLDFTQNGKRPADYVEYVENGTSVQAAQPFQAPALYQAVR